MIPIDSKATQQHNNLKQLHQLLPLILFSLCLLTLANSCKKEMSTNQDNPIVLIKEPMLIQNEQFPNGILRFNNQNEVNAFIEKEKANTTNHSVVNGFTSFKYIAKKHLLKEKERSENISQSNGIETEEITDTTEFINDINLVLAENEDLQSLLNQNLQIIYGDTLYQFSRIGMFKVEESNISQFLAFIEAYNTNILIDTTFNAFPNETANNDGSYSAGGGIVTRIPPISPDDPFPCEGAGCTGGGGGGGGTPPPCSVQLPANFQYGLHTTDTDFDKTVTKEFGDRRFVFKAKNDNFIFYKYIGIKGKLQRKKKFLGIRYWGPSYADEIIIGRDNMHVKTDYIFPYPQQFSSIYRPVVAGFSNASVGGDILNYLSIRININTPFGSISNSNLASIINGSFNNIVGGIYTNGFIAIENNILNSMDPTYISTYQNYIKKIEYLDNQNRLRFIEGKKELAEGYSHKKEWVFDWNAGFSYGGAPDPTYEYEMVGGSFYGRTRVGCSWYGLKIVVP